MVRHVETLSIATHAETPFSRPGLPYQNLVIGYVSRIKVLSLLVLVLTLARID